MATTQTLRGLSTICYYVADHEAARKWYTELLGIAPYFERPGYAEFRIGDYQHELGLIDRRYAPPGVKDSQGGVITYWHVDEVQGTLDRLLAMGATLNEPLVERGAGFVTASVLDPWGNVLGIMYNPHYLEILEQRRQPAAEK
ncbi:VOC family protein [Chitinophaga nivalis]|uniref:VOC family protein n=1 Tax=Chitinophaga nivalis TaxID=2991709 RepID=A0ABT3IMR6_9BACT|nr:VOC family protein [Chitinophaga nivalis]MCW3465075.1 VOC family protein [Chitinophaga nivalis]MCW3485233.1 VOC family protein [Chitinophaga nivalis]